MLFVNGVGGRECCTSDLDAFAMHSYYVIVMIAVATYGSPQRRLVFCAMHLVNNRQHWLYYLAMHKDKTGVYRQVYCQGYVAG